MIYEIRKQLKENQDIKYKKFNARIGITENVIGVRMPILKQMAREIAKGNYDKYLNKDLKYHEEIMLQGLIIGSIKKESKDLSIYIKNFVPKISNWSICDTFVWKLKAVQDDYVYFKTIIDVYLRSKQEYEIRFAIVLMLAYYLEDEYIDWVLDEVIKIKHEGYYVKMAIAWLVSVAYVDYPKKIETILKSEKLDTFTHNKSIQKIQESRMVSTEKKEKLKKLKRK